MCSNIVKEKIKNTMLERYGVVNASQSQEIKEKKINTSLKNNGTKYYAQSKEFLKKSSETFFKNHGVYSGFELIAKNNRLKGFEKLRVEGLDYNLELISVQVDTITYKCKTTDTIFSINRNTYKLRKKQQKTINLIELPLNNKISSLEKEIFEYVSSLNSTFTQSDTVILEGKEVDIISYDLNLGIEFNGLYWHCNLFKESNYHLNKTIQCNNNGIDLLHIFEDEWLYKKDIIKNVINKRLNLNVQLDANMCIIDKVNIDELRTFLDINYLYKYDLSYDAESLGLYYDDILVALVVIDNNNVTYVELLGIEIESGFDLLFNNYIELNNVNYLTARVDRGKFYDLTYLNSGFVFSHYIEPQSFYIYQNIRLNKLYKDYTNTIHDCGQIEYIWNQN